MYKISEVSLKYDWDDVQYYSPLNILVKIECCTDHTYGIVYITI